MLPHRPFYFLRHGETDWNKERRLQGLTDVPLNARGEAQAELARAAAAGLGLKSIAVSSLARARRTAEIVNRDLGLAMTHFDALREFDVGPFEGSTDGSWIDAWLQDQAIHGPETFLAFRERVRAGMIEALRLDHPVLIVAHGGVFWALQRLLGIAEIAHIPNAVVALFSPPDRDGAPWRIELL
jgi:broad specificity phosphatase PhoE